MSASPFCLHSRTRLVAQDSDAEYRECLDCGAILEKAELASAAAAQAASAAGGPERVPPSGAARGDASPQEPATEKSGFDESLSDA
jgi:hypothetical protein